MTKVIGPNALTLTACSIAESDADDGATWSSTTTYAADAPVRYNHVRYQSLAASNVGKDPSVEANNSGTAAVWRKLGATGPYKMLDYFVETQTIGTAGTPLTFTVPFDHANSFALFNLSADTVTVKITDGPGGDGVLFEETIEMVADIGSYSLYDYCFSRIKNTTDIVRSDIVYGVGGTLEVTVVAGTQTPSVGHVVVGVALQIGKTKFNAESRVTDYSKKTVDDFGVATLVPRSFAKRTSLPIYLHPDQSDYVAGILTSLRAKPCVWVGDNRDDGYNALTVFGWIEDWRSVYSGPNEQQLSVDIQGLI